MSLTVDGFLKHLSDSGVMSPQEVSSLEAKIPAGKRHRDAQELARELIRIKKLTPFQANSLCLDKPAPLVLGNYVFQDVIGTGGMGVVYKAQHRRMKRTVAVKVLSQSAIESKHLVKRFLREAQTAAKLAHPNIVTAYDADEIDGIPFLAMEFVDGVDLQIYVNNHGPMPTEKAIDCVLQAARGLEHAHSLGVIHRDMKPANILLNSQGVVKILDMGLARIQEGFPPLSSPDSTDMVDLTSAGQSAGICGTVDFMSPEQSLDSRAADQSSDIYSLGATLYFLITGKAMYEFPTIMERILAHREAKLPSICTISPHVPRQIDSIFHCMVAKTKELRYASMTDLIRDLTHWPKIEIATPIAARMKAKKSKTGKTSNNSRHRDRS